MLCALHTYKQSSYNNVQKRVGEGQPKTGVQESEITKDGKMCQSPKI